MELEYIDDLPDDGRLQGNGNRPHRELAEELRKNPGKWAKWPIAHKPKSAQGIAHNITTGRSKSLPAEEFEAVIRQNELYVRARPPKEWVTLSDGPLAGTSVISKETDLP